ncbi:hypothetical protein BKA62DRAFT_677611 [Auriculariales sp. MPI-PUGE-AT-0066]|nr:hypothetical protein BKA62DRAFT_677611 [Auriculariales sp. MPI-PUGE-AT-0066]
MSRCALRLGCQKREPASETVRLAVAWLSLDNNGWYFHIALLAGKESACTAEFVSCVTNKYQLRDYQILSLNWLNLLFSRELSCIVANKMGLVKTIQVISCPAHLKERGNHDQDFRSHNDKRVADQAYRIGQKVTKLISKGTIEEELMRLSETKLALDEAVAGHALWTFAGATTGNGDEEGGKCTAGRERRREAIKASLVDSIKR